MHTYLALLLMQESLFKSGLTTAEVQKKFKEHLRRKDDWREIRDKWIPYKWAFKQYKADLHVRNHEDKVKHVPNKILKRSQDFLREKVGHPFPPNQLYEKQKWEDYMQEMRQDTPVPSINAMIAAADDDGDDAPDDAAPDDAAPQTPPRPKKAPAAAPKAPKLKRS